MKIIAITALFGASFTLAPDLAAAQPTGPGATPITVNAGSRSLQVWSRQVSRDLDENLYYPRPLGGSDYQEGAVRVAFHCGEDGSPTGVSVAQSSHASAIDRAAVYAVAHIPTLHPLPDGVGHDRAMEAWVFFASDQYKVEKMRKGFERQAQLARSQTRDVGQETASLPPLIFASR